MKPDEILKRKHDILCHLSILPQKILSLHGRGDLAEFVLRELCHERCFHLKKAAFFVDNPDFNCLKGVAGYFHEDTPTVCDQLWDHPEKFMQRVSDAPFNKRVRDLWLPSLQQVKESTDQVVKSIGDTLEMSNPVACSARVKHGNQGLLVFEKENPADTHADEHIHAGLSLLGFCPIY